MFPPGKAYGFDGMRLGTNAPGPTEASNGGAAKGDDADTAMPLFMGASAFDGGPPPGMLDSIIPPGGMDDMGLAP